MHSLSPAPAQANVTSCACQTLDDFTSGSAFRLPVASIYQLLELDPNLLVTRLKIFFALFVGLFGAPAARATPSPGSPRVEWGCGSDSHGL